MNKTILGFALIASLHAKSVSGMVSAAVVTPPFASKTTQALYDDYRWFQVLNERDSAVESLAANRIRALLTANSLPTNLNDYNETKLALRQIQRCPAANRTNYYNYSYWRVYLITLPLIIFYMKHYAWAALQSITP